MAAMITRSEILEECKLKEAATALEEHEPESQYFRYWVPGEKYVSIESTASQLMDQLTHFSMEDQAMIFHAIAKRLPEPGDSVIIVDDRGGKRRTAYVARLKGPDNDIRLLITR